VAERTEEIRIKADQISTQSEELSAKNTELEEKNREIIRTQEQLIVQEKLASLGALTAGIAHEIKNPLNFMNNFSEVSVELAQEIKEDLQAQRDRLDPVLYKRIEASLSDLEQTASKIHEHGKKADGIVRGMLEHSRGKTGEIQPTNINALLEEYANLALHGFQAQDPTFEVEFEKHLDSSIGDLNVFPQDLSRVFLNIVNNSCYALNEKRKSGGKEFVPHITLTTHNNDNSVQIRIRDNGSGIPADVVEKVFNPFFTTKPTGKGTGLGLSLSHDVVVKQHGGTLDVETEEGTYTEFRITIPRRSIKTG
jgi:signal transduction histidine kinase